MYTSQWRTTFCIERTDFGAMRHFPMMKRATDIGRKFYVTESKQINKTLSYHNLNHVNNYNNVNSKAIYFIVLRPSGVAGGYDKEAHCLQTFLNMKTFNKFGII